MLKTLLVYAHLIATCAAIGTIVITDMRLLAKALGYRVVIPPPERFETRMIIVALSALYLTGGTIVYLGLAGDPNYLAANPKLQAKLVLVGVLTANAVMLHNLVFPILKRSLSVSAWSRRDWTVVALSVSLSNGLWFYNAFLGVARIWNGSVPIGFVLAVALAVWVAMCLAILAVLKLASRDAPMANPDWIDSVKASLSDFAGLREH